MVLSVPRVCNMVFQRCSNEIELGEVKGAAKNVNNLQYLEIGASHPCITLFFWRDGIIWYHLQLKTEPQITIHLCIPLAAICLFVQSLSEHLFNHPSIHPSSHACNACSAIQCNAGHFNSVRCASSRFNVFKSIQGKFSCISFHVVSIQFNQVPASNPSCQLNQHFTLHFPDCPGLLWLPMPFLMPRELYHKHLPKMVGQRIKRVQLICVTQKQMNIRVEQVFWIQLDYTVSLHSSVLNGHNAFLSLQRCYELWNLM